MEVPYAVVEAFTIGQNKGYTGNPAAVCFLQTDDQITDDVKQKIANTMNLSETAFVAKAWSRTDLDSNDEGKDKNVIKRTLRWFTPANEVSLCGHATLASAGAVFAQAGTQAVKIEFQSKFRGILTAETGALNGDRIKLNFPANYAQVLNTNYQHWLNRFAGVLLGPNFQGVKDVEEFLYCKEEKILVARLKSRDHRNENNDLIEKVAPSFEQLKQFPVPAEMAITIAIVTIQALPKVHKDNPDVYSRVFVPWFGINEDPVTGVAHTVLAPYWSKILGKTNLIARQASNRKGDLRCEYLREENRVEISGSFKIFCSGKINV